MTKKMLKFLCLIFCLPLFAEEKIEFPSPTQRQNAVLNFVAEINRLDGEGLIPRFNRPEDWGTTTKRLAEEAKSATDFFAFGRVFKKLDATYPNLHARVHLRQELDQDKAEGFIKLHFSIRPQLIDKNAKAFSYFIAEPEKDSKLSSGDQILEINGKPIQELEQENFLLCKFPLFFQCAFEFESNLKKEILNWSRSHELKLKLLRNNESIEVISSFEVIPWDKKSNPEEKNCKQQESRYQNFTLDYLGHNLCVFKSSKFPGRYIMRIKSFVYTQNDPMTDLKAEVEMFWFNYWRKQSHLVKELIIDVIGNYGGQSPIPYYGLFAKSPYQEQFVQFKKIKEFEQKEIFYDLFWGEKPKEMWFEDLKKSGQFSLLKDGEFLPTIPQFCTSQEKSCSTGLFEPQKHQFNGKIKILVDQWCISSCVGFVDNMVKLFKNRIQLYGHEDSADSAYSRLTLALSFDQKNEVIKLLPLSKAKKPDPPLPWVRQVVSVTRTTDQQGKILSGLPQKIDHWIPRPWNQSMDDWSKSVFKEALKR